jgi:hypothetical protein
MKSGPSALTVNFTSPVLSDICGGSQTPEETSPQRHREHREDGNRRAGGVFSGRACSARRRVVDEHVFTKMNTMNTDGNHSHVHLCSSVFIIDKNIIPGDQRSRRASPAAK